MSPNFTSYFSNGLEPQSETGGLMPDYVSAVISLCDSEGVLLYDSYHELGIDSTNYTEYLLDGCHPNEATRYTMAQGIAELLAPYAANHK
jgi:lysophospholipase L1-like esterase